MDHMVLTAQIKPLVAAIMRDVTDRPVERLTRLPWATHSALPISTLVDETGANVSEIKNKVIDIIADRLSRDKATITEASNIVADLGADSLDIAEIMMDLEDAFGVKLEDDQEVKTIGDVIKVIEAKTKK